jgi:hypothetical protein
LVKNCAYFREIGGKKSRAALHATEITPPVRTPSEAGLNATAAAK